jgi:hypothetical protein
MEPAAQAPPAMPATPAPRSAFVPTLLMALAIVGWLAFQGVQLARERLQLSELQTSLGAQAEAATKLRASLDTVATATAKLAADGNESARVIVEELRKRGVTINPQGLPKPP